MLKFWQSFPAIAERIQAPTPALIPNNRISVHLEGRTYPFVTPQKTVPAAFLPMPKRLFDGMDFTRIRDKSTAFKKFAVGLEKLATCRSEFNSLCDMVATAGGFDHHFKMADRPFAPSATAELAALPLTEVVPAMDQVLKLACCAFVQRMISVLDEMVNKQHCGVIDWPCEDACRYHYFIFKDETTILAERSHSSEQVGGRRHTVTTHTQRDKERVKSITRHVHDLIDAKRHPFSTFTTRRFPPRILPVVEKIGEWMNAQYIDGQQIRDLRIEREISREQWTDSENRINTWEEPLPRIIESPRYAYDPAIVIGHYVLVGWDQEEHTREITCIDCHGIGLHGYNTHHYDRDRKCEACRGKGTVQGRFPQR